MSDSTGADATPPITKPRATEPDPGAAAPAGVSRAALIWIGVAVVVLSFVASFLGASLARSSESADQAPTAVAEPSDTPSAGTPPSSEDYEAALEEILPAGSAVRAGTGVPEEGKGYEGDVYIDITSSDVYLFQDGAWVLVGNIRTTAAENLTGETGAAGAAGEAGATGSTGKTGAPGAPGTPGTQLSLGLGAPTDSTCQSDGDIYIDTEQLAFYECAGGAWTLFGPDEAPNPEG